MLKMKFSSLLICGLILALFCFRVTGLNKEVLFQENITVKEGESTHITCCWNKMTEAIFNFKVVWLKSEKRFSAENQTYQKSLTENCSTVHLRNITPNDEGEYVCQVSQDIPTLRQFRCKIILSLKTAQQGNKTQTTAEKPVITGRPKTHPEDKISSEGHSVDSQNESSDLRDIVVIYIFRCLPILTLLVAFLYLNRDDKRVITSEPDGPAEASGEQPEEDLESGNKCRIDTEDVKQDEKASVQEEERDTTEKPKTAEETQEEKDQQEEEKETIVLLHTEGVMLI